MGMRHEPFGRFFSVVTAIALASMPFGARADEPVGKIVGNEGVVKTGPSSGDRRTVRTGSLIGAGDRITTGATGLAEIEFQDGIRLTVGPSTDLKIRSYFLGADRPLAGIVDLFEGAVRVEVPGTVRDTLDFQTNTAAFSGRHAVWTLIAEEENTQLAVRTGTVQAQKLDIGRGPVGPVISVKASFGLEIPATSPAAAPRKLGETEVEALGLRLMPKTRSD